MSELLDRLRRNQRKGSKPRCHALTHGTAADVSAALTRLTHRSAVVASTDHWMPGGFEPGRLVEATLPEADRLLSSGIRSALKEWWLAVPGPTMRTPNWDIASTCKIDGANGLLLVEAKAHSQELIKEETGKKSIEPPASAASRRNHRRIGWCMDDANIALAGETGLPWALSRDWNYQMSNRFAWAWKLTELGVPVVLVYLGFLRAAEMETEGRRGESATKAFANHADWEALLKAHSAPLLPEQVWGRRWVCHGRGFTALMSSVEQPLP